MGNCVYLVLLLQEHSICPILLLYILHRICMPSVYRLHFFQYSPLLTLKQALESQNDESSSQCFREDTANEKEVLNRIVENCQKVERERHV